MQKIEKRKKERENLTWRSPGSPTDPAMQLAGPAPHCSPSVVFLPLPRSSCVPGAQASRASSSLPAWLPPRRPGRLPRRHATPPTLSHSLWISPLPLFSPPRATADVARNHRGHSHFLAPSPRTRAQPGPQAHLRRPTKARMPQDDAAALLPRPRPPDAAVRFILSAVSSSTPTCSSNSP